MTVRHTRTLRLEPLEERLVPTFYGWVGKGPDNLWQDGLNWRFVSGTAWISNPKMFPGVSTADVSGDREEQGARQSSPNARVEISGMTITAQFLNDLSLNAPLMLLKGGTFGGDRLSNVGGSTITIAGGTFTWRSGNLDLGDPATFFISAGATANFNYGLAIPPVRIGYKIVNGGTLNLNNQGTINFTKRATVENSGVIDITSTGTFGGGVASIGNGRYALIEKTGTGTYTIQNALKNFGTLILDLGTLIFNGSDSTSGFSVTDMSAIAALNTGTTLKVAHGFQQTGNSILTAAGFPTAGGSTIDGNVDIKNGKKLKLVASATCWCLFCPVQGTFTFEAGTVTVYWNTLNKQTSQKQYVTER